MIRGTSARLWASPEDDDDAPAPALKPRLHNSNSGDSLAADLGLGPGAAPPPCLGRELAAASLRAPLAAALTGIG